MQVSVIGSLANIPTERKSKKIISTIANAVSIGANGDSDIYNLGLDGTETEVWLFVNIDQQPWSLLVSVAYMTNIRSATTTTPSLSPNTKVFTDLAIPAITLWHGLRISPDNLPNAPTTINEAKAYIIPGDNSATCQIKSNSANIATCTIRVLRIWR